MREPLTLRAACWLYYYERGAWVEADAILATGFVCRTATLAAAVDAP